MPVGVPTPNGVDLTRSFAAVAAEGELEIEERLRLQIRSVTIVGRVAQPPHNRIPEICREWRAIAVLEQVALSPCSQERAACLIPSRRAPPTKLNNDAFDQGSPIVEADNAPI